MVFHISVRYAESTKVSTNAFIKGKFSVKQNNKGKFNLVGADMCFEQTINCSSKGKAVMETKTKDSFTVWKLIYHEMLAVNNLGQEISGPQLESRELEVHHKDTKAEIERREHNIQTMMQYIH